MKTYSVGPQGERFEETGCKLCDSDRFRPILADDGYRFVRCLDCGLVYQNPQPVFDDLIKRYSRSYFEYELRNEENFFNLIRLGLNDIEFEKLPAAGSALHGRSGTSASMPPAGRRSFLDIGCATGRLLEHMRESGWKVQGVEICRESAEYGIRRRNLEIFTGRLQEADFAEASFSVIHFSHLIEHVPDPKGFMMEVARILTPDGYVVITTPNIRGLQARLLKESWRSAIADHLTLFSKTTLKCLLAETGFKVLKTKTWGGLAQGLAPPWIKRPLDRLAKRFGFGDVILFLSARSEG